MNALLKIVWNVIFTLTGFDISFDARYRDWSFFLIELRADYLRVKNTLTKRHFVPLETNPGETRLFIVGCDMRDVQIAGPYREVAIQVPIVPLDTEQGESFTHLFLPVNTEAARWPGMDIMGFPKFVADIDFNKNENQIGWRLSTNDEFILEFKMENQFGTKQHLIWSFYGNRRHRIVKTIFDLEGFIWEGAGMHHASLVLGTHAVSETLRNLLISDEIIRTMIGHDISGVLRKPVRMQSQARTR